MSRPEQLGSVTPVAEALGALDNARAYGIALVASAVVAAGFGAARAEAQEQQPVVPDMAAAKTIQEARFPAITQRIDGAEEWFHGDPSQEQEIADKCKDYSRIWTIRTLDF